MLRWPQGSRVVRRVTLGPPVAGADTGSAGIRPVRPGQVWITHASSLVGVRRSQASSGTAGIPRYPAVPNRPGTYRESLPQRRHYHGNSGNEAAGSLLACAGSPTSPGSRLARAKDIRRREMVPGTTLADLDHVDLELSVFRCHFSQFWSALHAALVPAELVAVDVGDVGEVRLPADRAGGLGRLAVKLRRAEQVRVRIAERPSRWCGRRRPTRASPAAPGRSPPPIASCPTGYDGSALRPIPASRSGRPAAATTGRPAVRRAPDLRPRGRAHIFAMYRLDTSPRATWVPGASRRGC